MENKPNPCWGRISRIIEHYHYPSISAFARDISLIRSENLYQIKRGNNGISWELAEKIAERFPEVNKAWVFTGEGSMLSGSPEVPVLQQIAGIPFYGNFPKERPPAVPDKTLYFSKELIDNADFAVAYRTDELYPMYRKNTVLLLRRWAMNNPVIFGELYFIITDYCRLFRMIRKGQTPGEVCLESPNKEKYDDITIPSDDIRELYLVL